MTDMTGFRRRVNEAAKEALLAVDQLPVQTSAMHKDSVWALVFNTAMGSEGHAVGHCPQCLATALEMANHALGWQRTSGDQPTIQDAKERMRMLTELVTSALDYLEKLSDDAAAHGAEKELPGPFKGL